MESAKASLAMLSAPLPVLVFCLCVRSIVCSMLSAFSLVENIDCSAIVRDVHPPCFLFHKFSLDQHDFHLNHSRKMKCSLENNVDFPTVDVSMVTEIVMVEIKTRLLKTCRPGWNEVEVMFEIL